MWNCQVPGIIVSIINFFLPVQPIDIHCDGTGCGPDFIQIDEVIPGACCPNVTCVPRPDCEVDGNTYAFKDPVPSDNPCMVDW